MATMYCLKCYYDLRGLPANRCPECGRGFSPDNPASFSSTPRPDRLHKLVRQASDLLTDALSAIETTDPATRALAPVRRAVARLSAENASLRRQVAALTQVLLDAGVIDPAALADAMDRAEVDSDLPVVDDTPTDDDGDGPVPSELLDLQRVVESHQRDG